MHHISLACKWWTFLTLCIVLSACALRCLLTRASLRLRILNNGHSSPDVPIYLFSCRFVCCVMVAIPLAATLFTTIIVWQRSREVSPSGESSSLNTGLNLYGTLKSNDSSGSEMNGNISEENSKYMVSL